MINTRKSFKVVIADSNNPLEDLLKPVNTRAGFISSKLPVYPIYFFRYIGLNKSSEQYLQDINDFDSKLANSSDNYVKFTGQIPLKSVDPALMNKTNPVWNNISTSKNLSPMNITDLLAKSNVFPVINNSLLSEAIKSSFEKALNLYIENEFPINITKIKNFSIKTLTWINDYTTKLFKNVNIALNNPKVLYYGDIKKHEIYFLIYLSQIGVDVIFINSNSDCDFNKIDKNNRFTTKKEFNKKAPLKPLFTKAKNISRKQVKPITNKPSTKTSSAAPVSKNTYKRINLSTEDRIHTNLKTAHDLFDEFVESLEKRSGFIGGKSPIMPVYFYRYIGTDRNVDKYYNSLYRLDKKLSSKQYSYIRFENNIPLVNNTTLLNNCSKIWSSMSPNNIKPSELVDSLYSQNAFPHSNNKTLTTTFIYAFESTVELFLKRNKNCDIHKIKNFAMKLVLWLNEYAPKLTASFDATNIKGALNPKIIYYGNIKKHEAYFLYALSKIGCDIIYINSDNDDTFRILDPNCDFTYLIEFDDKHALKMFPKEEIIVRAETTAFKASSEISQIIYNDSDGIYKPWQFESYETKPITLKTTIDEVTLLWKEEARMRTGFKVENNTVYIPNLFVKISGVYDDLNKYWQDLSIFKNTVNTLLYTQVPFSDTTFSREDIYKCAYVLDKNGYVDKEKLFSSQFYNYSYLKTHLQDTIVHKINQLFSLPIFKDEMNKDFKLLIIISILTMDKQILNLIQNFDYPFAIPKLVIYDNNENMFSKQDIAVLAFLNLLGFDILILTPTGYNNVENAIKQKYYDIHRLQKVEFDLQLPNLINKTNKKSFWSSFFGRP